MINIPVRIFLSMFCTCAIVVIWLANAAIADSGVFHSLVQAAQQWQDAHPSVCGQDTATCGVQKMLSQFQACKAFRIVNGCPIGDQTIYGWQVGVVLGGALCSGTLVSPTHVVCAGHCVQGLSPTDTDRITVYIGAKSLRAASTAQKHGVARFAANPAFDPDVIVNDASILELSSPVNFDQNGIRPACLPTGPVPRSLTSLVIGGYGIDDYKKQTGAGTLRYTVVSVTSDATCSALYGADQYNATSTFCAIGERARLGTDSCNGDSGSAVMSKASSGDWRLVGIVSYGTDKCATAPGVYSDAFNCGIRASAVAIKRAAQQDKKSADRCATKRSDKLKQRPRQPIRRPVVGTNGKKVGGVGSDMAETVRLHGCKHNSDCMSNVCREIEACHTLHADGDSPVAAREEQEELSTTAARYRESPAFTSVVERPVRPINEDVAIAEQPSLFRRQCSKLNVCWLPAWIESYTTTPVFDFDAIVDEDEEVSANVHKESEHKKP